MKKCLLLLCVLMASTTFAAGSLPSSTSGSSKRSSSGGGRKYKIYIGAGYSLQTKASFASTTDSATTGSYLTELNFNDNANLEVGFAYLPNYGFGLLGGVNYEFEKKIHDSKINGVSSSNSNASVQVTNILLGTAFRFDNVYIPVSAIYSLINMKADSNFVGSFDVKGGLGGQAGLGVLLNDKVSFEWLYRYNAINIYSRTNAGFVQDFGNGNLTSFDLIFKLYF